MLAWTTGALAAPERCNGLDDDGDGGVDEPPLVWGQDEDGDGAGGGDDAWLTQDCTTPPGAVAGADDCDDSASAVHPGAPETCNGRDDDCDGGIDEDLSCKCESSLDAGSIWQRCDGDGGDWFYASDTCTDLGSHLASIDGESAQEAAEFLLLPFNTDFWIGGNDLGGEGSWAWSDSSLFSFTRWRDEQPDNGGGSYDDEDCMEMTSTGEWNDRVCEVELPYLCERECTDVFFADLDGDGLGDAFSLTVGCAISEGYVLNALDCDDLSAAQPTVLYLDLDADSYGDDTSAVLGCNLDGSWVDIGGDCDDGASDVSPGAIDLPGDGTDADCDGQDTPSTQTTEDPLTEPPEGSLQDTIEDTKAISPSAPPYGFGCGCSGATPPGTGVWGLLWLLASRRDRPRVRL